MGESPWNEYHPDCAATATAENARNGSIPDGTVLQPCAYAVGGRVCGAVIEVRGRRTHSYQASHIGCLLLESYLLNER